MSREFSLKQKNKSELVQIILGQDKKIEEAKVIMNECYRLLETCCLEHLGVIPPTMSEIEANALLPETVIIDECVDYFDNKKLNDIKTIDKIRGENYGQKIQGNK